MLPMPVSSTTGRMEDVPAHCFGGWLLLCKTFRILVSRSDIDLHRMDTDSFNSLVDIRWSALRPNGWQASGQDAFRCSRCTGFDEVAVSPGRTPLLTHELPRRSRVGVAASAKGS